MHKRGQINFHYIAVELPYVSSTRSVGTDMLFCRTLCAATSVADKIERASIREHPKEWKSQKEWQRAGETDTKNKTNQLWGFFQYPWFCPEIFEDLHSLKLVKLGLLPQKETIETKKTWESWQQWNF